MHKMQLQCTYYTLNGMRNHISDDKSLFQLFIHLQICHLTIVESNNVKYEHPMIVQTYSVIVRSLALDLDILSSRYTQI